MEKIFIINDLTDDNISRDELYNLMADYFEDCSVTVTEIHRIGSIEEAFDKAYPDKFDGMPPVMRLAMLGVFTAGYGACITK